MIIIIKDRISKNNYYLDIAETVAQRSTCLSKLYGAVIVKNDEIISTGYNGAPRGRKNCCDIGECYRIKHDIRRGQDYTSCRSVHAEQNAIISTDRASMLGATLYISGYDLKINNYVENANSCSICKRIIINSGIDKVVIRDDKTHYREILTKEWIENDDTLDINRVGY